MTYEWNSRAFKNDGPCGICGEWTRSGVRPGGIRFRPLCYPCAVNRFAGEIMVWDGGTRAALIERGFASAPPARPEDARGR